VRKITPSWNRNLPLKFLVTGVKILLPGPAGYRSTPKKCHPHKGMSNHRVVSRAIPVLAACDHTMSLLSASESPRRFVIASLLISPPIFLIPPSIFDMKQKIRQAILCRKKFGSLFVLSRLFQEVSQPPRVDSRDCKGGDEQEYCQDGRNYWKSIEPFNPFGHLTLFFLLFRFPFYVSLSLFFIRPPERRRMMMTWMFHALERPRIPE